MSGYDHPPSPGGLVLRVMQIAISYCFALSGVKRMLATTAKKISCRDAARATPRIDMSSGGSHTLLMPRAYRVVSWAEPTRKSGYQQFTECKQRWALEWKPS